MAVSSTDPAVPSHLSASLQTGDDALAANRAMDEESGPRAGPAGWPKGKVIGGARAVIWTETEAGIQTGAGGKVFAETGIVTGSSTWAEVGAEWRPGHMDREEVPSIPRSPAVWLGPQRLQMHGEGQREQRAFPSVPTILAETVGFQAAILRKPLGLLSKAAWTRSPSLSSSKASSSSAPSSTIKASSSSPPAASNGESQTVMSDQVSLILDSSNSSNSNNSSSSGKIYGFVAL